MVDLDAKFFERFNNGTQWAFVGTRISIDHIVGLFAQGWSEETILENHPRLKKEDLQAVFAYLYDCMKDSLLYTNVRKSA
jgi:uncharacterized protein (DUF433 family)